VEYAMVAIVLVMMGLVALKSLSLVQAHTKQWGTAAEFTARCQDESAESQRKAIGAAIASGIQPADLGAPKQPTQTRAEAQVSAALDQTAEELGTVN
jgi:hypothetical protein